MPKEFENCKRSLIGEGKSPKDAARICAIAFFKRHGKRPQDVESALSSYETALFNVLEVLYADE